MPGTGTIYAKIISNIRCTIVLLMQLLCVNALLELQILVVITIIGSP